MPVEAALTPAAREGFTLRVLVMVSSDLDAESRCDTPTFEWTP